MSCDAAIKSSLYLCQKLHILLLYTKLWICFYASQMIYMTDIIQSSKSLGVKFHLKHKEKMYRDTSICFCVFVSLSIVSVGGVRHMGGRSTMLHRNLRGGGNKIMVPANRYTNFGQLIIRKIIKILPPNVTLKNKIHNI